ncbi:MAG TPA: MFS transporter [Micromonosporaceae bacterium]
MALEPYRRVLALPGVRPLLLIAMLARVPVTAAAITLTLHVVLDLDRGYGAAGLVGAALTVGMALGAPLFGRLVDRRGMRPMLAITTIAGAAFWAGSPALSYPALLGAALLGGAFVLPAFSIVRQSLAALVPEEQRRQAYALDSMSVELSYMVGPAAAVLIATTARPTAAMIAIGAGLVLAGAALYALNPPTRADHEPAIGDGAPIRRRAWLTPRLLAILVIASATTLVLGGTDVSVVAILRQAGEVQWTGVVLTLWGAYSMVGGFWYGAAPRPVSPLTLMLLLAALTIPVGLAGGDWRLLGLALVPAGALCAPTLASAAEAVSRLVPAGARGEAMGLHGSALTAGLAVGAPLAGVVIDATGPSWGFAAIGVAGGLAALVALPTLRRHAAPIPPPATTGSKATAIATREA